MRRRLFVLPIVVVCALAVSAPAFAVGWGLPHLSRAESKWVGALVDRYVKDVVLRQNLADGWKISGPQMRGGGTRKEFLAGNVPVQRLNLIGHSWANAWSATEKIPNELAMDVSLRVGRGEAAQMYIQNLTLNRINGTWFVNGWYTNAVFRLGKGHDGSCATPDCKVTAINDFKPGSRGGEGSGPLATVGGNWSFYALIATIVGVPLSVMLGFGLYARSRNRRAWAEYLKYSAPRT